MKLQNMDPAVAGLVKLLGVKITDYDGMVKAGLGYELAHPSTPFSGGFYLADADIIAVNPHPIRTQWKVEAGHPAPHIDTTVLHELIHWSGAEGRMSRPAVMMAADNVPRSDRDTHTEEAVAQMGMYKLGVIIGLSGVDLKHHLDSYLEGLYLADMALAEKQSDDAVVYLLNTAQKAIIKRSAA